MWGSTTNNLGGCRDGLTTSLKKNQQMVDILNFQRHESKYRNVLRWTVDTHQESIHFRNPKIRVPRWNEQPLRNSSQDSAKWHWKRQCGRKEKRPTHRGLHGILARQWPHWMLFFFNESETLAANMPWPEKMEGSGESFGFFLLGYHGVEARPNARDKRSQHFHLWCHLNSAPPFHHLLAKGQTLMPAARRFPKEKEMVWTGIKIPLFNVYKYAPAY